ncbi:hypothetical protein C1646_768845 [Rhizophagus diaphanus]|nr:hypothetical protein C1646_768845 [Rhizophagus diaphanus] [Rhizophagus sp. MUCL 43196]
MSNLLNDIKNCLPRWTVWNDYNIPSPILIIDEANMFNQLGDSDPTLLKSVLNWMVLNTKQESRFNIVLTSSDSFFLNWIVTQLHIPRVTRKEEAEKYFEEHVLPYNECNELKGKFDHVCRITGTRMMVIRIYVKEYKNSEGTLKDSEFSVFRLEDDKLSYALNPVRFPGKPAPLWNKDDFIKVMKAIVNAEDRGYIKEIDLVKEIGVEKVKSLITYDLLHRRPTNNFTYDIIDPPNKSILTAMNKPAIRAR